MKATVGDAILIESEKAGLPAHTGEILEVLEAPYGTSFHVRWDDGHESTIHPMPGTMRIRHPGDAADAWQPPS